MPLPSVRTVPRDVWAAKIVVPVLDVPALDAAALVVDGVALGVAALLPLLQAAAARTVAASGTARIHPRKTPRLVGCMRGVGIGDSLPFSRFSLPVPSALGPPLSWLAPTLITGQPTQSFIPLAGNVAEPSGMGLRDAGAVRPGRH